MSQYHPCYKARSHPILSRRLLRSEYDEVVAYAEKLGLDNCYVQELVSSDDWLPDFSKDEPFNRSHQCTRMDTNLVFIRGFMKL
jgi:putative pyruvate formate lyase activating enzyme